MLAFAEPAIDLGWSQSHQASLLRGDIALETQPHSAWGGAVTAQMHLPLERAKVWSRLTDYPRWTQYFPSLTQSRVIAESAGRKQLYQAAGKTFLCFTAQVEIYLNVIETVHPLRDQIRFQLDEGSFSNFAALLKLQDCGDGTLLTYTVQATPSLPIPTQIIQEGMRFDLPRNMRSLRRAICQG